MAEYEYVTVDVFTDTRFRGNPLAVFPRAEGLSSADMQSLAAEMNYSETTFVLPPEEASNTARVRIFTSRHEMPFAGHPNVGTAFALAHIGHRNGETMRFEELAGTVDVRLIESRGMVIGANIDAPQPLQLFGTLPVHEIADCLSLSPDQIRVESHEPIRASVGVEFVLVEVEPDALAAASPSLEAFRRIAAARPELNGRISVLLYASAMQVIHARMFAPLSGTWEDPATGSANAALTALRLSLSDSAELEAQTVQGEQMGRRSILSLRAWRTAEGIRSSVGGRCALVFRGGISL